MRKDGFKKISNLDGQDSSVFLQIPGELLIQIFLNLDPVDLYHLTLTCGFLLNFLKDEENFKRLGARRMFAIGGMFEASKQPSILSTASYYHEHDHKAPLFFEIESTYKQPNERFFFLSKETAQAFLHSEWEGEGKKYTAALFQVYVPLVSLPPPSKIKLKSEEIDCWILDNRKAIDVKPIL